jgi:hypothetical protein
MNCENLFLLAYPAFGLYHGHEELTMTTRDAQFSWTFLRAVICITAAGVALFAYINRHNQLIELRRKIPRVSKEVKSLLEDNNRLKYEIDRFESPIHLMELLRKPEFSHLQYVYTRDVIEILEGNISRFRSIQEKNDDKREQKSPAKP